MCRAKGPVLQFLTTHPPKTLGNVHLEVVVQRSAKGCKTAEHPELGQLGPSLPRRRFTAAVSPLSHERHAGAAAPCKTEWRPSWGPTDRIQCVAINFARDKALAPDPAARSPGKTLAHTHPVRTATPSPSQYHSKLRVKNTQAQSPGSAAVSLRRAGVPIWANTGAWQPSCTVLPPTGPRMQ